MFMLGCITGFIWPRLMVRYPLKADDMSKPHPERDHKLVHDI